MVFASGDLSISDMAKPGFVANCIAICSVTIWVLVLALPVFDIEINQLPPWVPPQNSTISSLH